MIDSYLSIEYLKNIGCADSNDWTPEQLHEINRFCQMSLKEFPLPEMELDDKNGNSSLYGDYIRIMNSRWDMLLPVADEMCIAQGERPIGVFEQFYSRSASFALPKITKLFDLFILNNDYNSACELIPAFSKHDVYESKVFKLIDLCLGSDDNKYINYFTAYEILSRLYREDHSIEVAKLLNYTKKLVDKTFENYYHDVIIRMITDLSLPKDLLKDIRQRFLESYANQQAVVKLASCENAIRNLVGNKDVRKAVQEMTAGYEAGRLMERITRKP